MTSDEYETVCKTVITDEVYSKNSTVPMIQIEGNIPTSDIEVDAHGNLVIKNKTLAHMVEQFLQSEDATKMQRAEAHLLCCKLQCPVCEP